MRLASAALTPPSACERSPGELRALDGDPGGHAPRDAERLEEVDPAVERGGERHDVAVDHRGHPAPLLTEQEEQGLVVRPPALAGVDQEQIVARWRS